MWMPLLEFCDKYSQNWTKTNRNQALNQTNTNTLTQLTITKHKNTRLAAKRKIWGQTGSLLEHGLREEYLQTAVVFEA